MPPQPTRPTRRSRTERVAAAPDVVLQCAPGLERLLWREVSSLAPDAQREGVAVLPRRNALLRINIGEESFDDILRTRIAEDVFCVISRGSVRMSLDGLRDIDALVHRAANVETALRHHADLHGGRGSKAVSTFRVVVRAAHDRAYRRIDVQARAVAVLGVRLGKRWKAVADGAQVEFWLTLLEHEAILAVRLTDETQRRRDKTSHLPGSLRPAVAAALVRLSEPRDDDVVVDPFCGAGTILMERGAAGRHRMLLGGDLDPDALAAATTNIGARHKPMQLQQWDAMNLPLEAESVDAVITNPPFGIKVVTGPPLAVLLPRFVAEAHRILRPGGRIVVLAHEPARFRKLLDGGQWTAITSHAFELQGRAVAALRAIRV